MKLRNKIIFIALFFPVVSMSAENIYLSYEEECQKKFETPTNASITQCALFANKYALKDIEVMYGQIYSTLKEKYGKTDAETFKRAQFAWMTFRNETCTLEGSAVDGESPMKAVCELGFNIRRVNELDNLFETIQ